MSMGTTTGQSKGPCLLDGLNRGTWEPSCHHFCSCTNREFDHAGRIRLLEWWGLYPLSVNSVTFRYLIDWTSRRIACSKSICPVNLATCSTTAFSMCMTDLPNKSGIKSIKCGMNQFTSYHLTWTLLYLLKSSALTDNIVLNSGVCLFWEVTAFA